MSNGILNSADFENKIRNMPDRELSEFVAREIFSFCRKQEQTEIRLNDIENINKKSFLLTGMGGVGAGTAIVVLFQWLLAKMGVHF